MANEIMVAAPQDQMAALEVRQQVNQLQYLMQNVLQKGEHYGVIPGTKGKPTLLQSGAEKICLMFKLVPRYRVTRTELGGGHREIEVTCTLYQRGGDVVEGEGIGSCSTLESKYRYRWTGKGDARQKKENPDIADTYNTVLKMAKKRALVDAVKSTTAASDIFTQDIEDLPPEYLQAQPAQAVEVEPARPSATQEDLTWLRSLVEVLAGMGYKASEVKPYLWERFKSGGRQEAMEAFEAMKAAAGQQAQPEQPVEADAYEDQDIDF